MSRSIFAAFGASLVLGLLAGGCANPDEEPEQNVATYNSADPADVARQPVLPSGAAGTPGPPAPGAPKAGGKSDAKSDPQSGAKPGR